MRIFSFILLGLLFSLSLSAQLDRFLNAPAMKGASVSFMLKDIINDTVLISYDADRELIPASVLKLVTTATALELLCDNFRYATSLQYDGHIRDSTLFGNLYVVGSGDPTLCSSEINQDCEKLMSEWVTSVRKAGIKAITGSVVADERIFDFEGVSMKWLLEDLGSYYAPGSYGLNIFDNRLTLFLRTDHPDSMPVILRTEPEMPSLVFNNYLKTSLSGRDSSFIIGLPYANERSLYGVVPANRYQYSLKGDIPEPSLFLASLFSTHLQNAYISVQSSPVNHRLLSQAHSIHDRERKLILTYYSPPLKEIVRITNYTSHNLYADALLKTIGLGYKTDETLSSFEKGVRIIKQHWEEKGLDTSSLWMFDGCGLALTDKLTASFVCDLLSYMYKQSPVSKAFVESLPRVGLEGTVANTLRGSRLQEVARLKSGSMSRIRSYAGYIKQDEKLYAVAIIVNNFACTQSQMRMQIERLLLSFLNY